MLIFIVLLLSHFVYSCDRVCRPVNGLICINTRCFRLHRNGDFCDNVFEICQLNLRCFEGTCQAVPEIQGGAIGEFCNLHKICQLGLTCLLGTCIDPINGGGKGGPGEFDNCTTTEDCGLNEVCLNGFCNLQSSIHISSALIIVLIFILLLLLAIISTLISICRKQKGNVRVTVMI